MDFTNHLDLCTETEARKGLLPARADESHQLKQQGKQKIGQSHSSWRNGVNESTKSHPHKHRERQATGMERELLSAKDFLIVIKAKAPNILKKATSDALIFSMHFFL